MNISKEVLLEDIQWCEEEIKALHQLIDDCECRIADNRKAIEEIKALHQLIDDYECRIADNRKAIEEIESREDSHREAKYDAWKDNQYEN